MTYWINVYEGGFGRPWPSRELAEVYAIRMRTKRVLYRIKVRPLDQV